MDLTDFDVPDSFLRHKQYSEGCQFAIDFLPNSFLLIDKNICQLNVQLIELIDHPVFDLSVSPAGVAPQYTFCGIAIWLFLS